MGVIEEDTRSLDYSDYSLNPKPLTLRPCGTGPTVLFESQLCEVGCQLEA